MNNTKPEVSILTISFVKKHLNSLFSNNCLSGIPIVTVILFLSAFIVLGSLHTGCAPLPPIDEPSAKTPPPISTGEQVDTAERDSIIAVTRSFAFERWKNGDFETARQHFLTVRLYDTEHTQNIYRIWADCFIRSNMLDSAQFAYEEGIRYFPDDDYLRSSLAIIFRNSGKWDEAIAQQKEALRIKPDDERYLIDLQALYESADQWDNAIATLQRLVELKPDDKDLRDRLTSLIRSKRSPDEFLAELKKNVEQFPDDPQPRYNFASELFNQGFNKEAVEQFDIYLKQEPANIEAWRKLAHARENLGDWNGAIAALRKIVELQPKSVIDIVEIGRGYLNLSQWIEARRWGARALEAESGYGPALVLMGDAYFKCADVTSGDNPKFNDKLVFAIAYGLFERAANSSHPQAKADGERGMRILTQSELVPSKEDRFMNKGKNRPTGKAYEWIDPSTSEVQYLDRFLAGLDK